MNFYAIVNLKTMISVKKISGLLLTFLFCVSLGHARPQKMPNNPRYDDKLLHFGFLLGSSQLGLRLKTLPNFSKINDTLLGVHPKNGNSFMVGIVSDLRLGEYFNLRFVPNLTLGERSLVYTFKRDATTSFKQVKSIESSLIEFPLEIKWKAARLVNSRPYVIGGVRYCLDLASLAEKKNENKDEYFLKLKRDDVGVGIGVGWDFFLPLNNKLAIEIRYYYGFNDLLVRENNIYTNSIDKLTSQMWQFTITFE